MKQFEDVEEVIEWLEPLGYLEFWNEVESLDLGLPDRDHCDDEIAKGRDTTADMLAFLKGLTRVELTARFSLKRRTHVAWITLQ